MRSNVNNTWVNSVGNNLTAMSSNSNNTWDISKGNTAMMANLNNTRRYFHLTEG